MAEIQVKNKLVTLEGLGASYNALDSKKINKSGGTITGNIEINHTGDAYIGVHNPTTDAQIYLDVDPNGKSHGVWSPGYVDDEGVFHQDSRWLVYRDSNNAVLLYGRANSAVGVVDPNSPGHVLTISYFTGDPAGASPTNWLPMYTSTGDLVPVSISNFAAALPNIKTVVKTITLSNGTSSPTTATISFTDVIPASKKIVGVASIRVGNYMIPYVINSGLVGTYVSNVYDSSITITNRVSAWENTTAYITLILADA